MSCEDDINVEKLVEALNNFGCGNSVDESNRFIEILKRPEIPGNRMGFKPRSVEKLPGNNQPCTCGSGNKYKKCCKFKKS